MVKFKLQSVLKLREQAEEAEKRELGRLRMQEAQLHKQQEVLLRQMAELRQHYEASVSGAIHIREIESIRQYLKVLEMKKKTLEEELIKMASQISQQQQRLHDAMKDRKMMDKLKEMKYEQYLEEEKQKEQLLTDELVSYKYSTIERSESSENNN
ncbi:MAG: flagellar export protein FliJ [Cellulosilyticaceae bacterium]